MTRFTAITVAASAISSARARLIPSAFSISFAFMSYPSVVEREQIAHRASERPRQLQREGDGRREHPVIERVDRLAADAHRLGERRLRQVALGPYLAQAISEPLSHMRARAAPACLSGSGPRRPPRSAPGAAPRAP